MKQLQAVDDHQPEMVGKEAEPQDDVLGEVTWLGGVEKNEACEAARAAREALSARGISYRSNGGAPTVL
jgi:hypothetical protein